MKAGAVILLGISHLAHQAGVLCALGCAEQRRLSTPMGLEHVRALVEQYQDCRVHVVYEACGFGYEIAWWLQEHGVATTVIAPSRMERAPGLAVKTDRLDAAPPPEGRKNLDSPRP